VPKFYQVRDWESLQHYKDRSPAWVKLHRDLLDSEDWILWPDSARVLAVTCMLLASRSPEGKIKDHPEYIGRWGHLNGPADLAPLVESGFLIECAPPEASPHPCKQPASGLLAQRKQDAPQRREEKRERIEEPKEERGFSGSAALNAGEGGPESAGAVAARLTAGARKSITDKVREILSVTGEPPEYAAFWESNIRTALEHDREHGTSLYTELAEAVTYAQDCVRNGREKDLGPLTNPGAFIVKRITPVFHAYGVKLARPPESAKPKPTPTRAGA